MKTYLETENDPHRERRSLRFASQIMTRNVVLLDASHPIGDAWQLVQRHNFHHMPVVNANSKIVGIISDRDILMALYQQSPAILTNAVDVIMTKQVITGGPDTRIREIAEVMLSHGIGCVPIVSDDDKVIGMVTRTDILRSVTHDAPVELWS